VCSISDRRDTLKNPEFYYQFMPLAGLRTGVRSGDRNGSIIPIVNRCSASRQIVACGGPPAPRTPLQTGCLFAASGVQRSFLFAAPLGSWICSSSFCCRRRSGNWFHTHRCCSAEIAVDFEIKLVARRKSKTPRFRPRPPSQPKGGRGRKSLIMRASMNCSRERSD